MSEPLTILTKEEEAGLREALARGWGVPQYLGPLLATLDAERAEHAIRLGEWRDAQRVFATSEAQVERLEAKVARLREVLARAVSDHIARDDCEDEDADGCTCTIPTQMRRVLAETGGVDAPSEETELAFRCLDSRDNSDGVKVRGVGRLLDAGKYASAWEYACAKGRPSEGLSQVAVNFRLPADLAGRTRAAAEAAGAKPSEWWRRAALAYLAAGAPAAAIAMADLRGNDDGRREEGTVAAVLTARELAELREMLENATDREDGCIACSANWSKPHDAECPRAYWLRVCGSR